MSMNELQLINAANELAGTCKALFEVVDSAEDEDALADILAEREQFCCQTCGWWSYPQETESVDGNCEDCEEEISG